MNIYIDCGVNEGSDIDCFRKLYNADEWRIIGFEPAPYCVDYLKKNKSAEWWKGIEFHQAGVSDHDGKETFYEGSWSKSGTLREDKKTYLNGKTTTVDVVDFAEFLSQFNKDDYIIVTMDMEGSEYDVLDHLVKSDKMQMINEIYVEFHTRKMKKDESKRELNLIHAMNKHIGKDNVYICEIQNHHQFKKLIKE
jgi:FkbM family methyltransferase